MDCPKCGGEMYDNRNTKKNPKAPDYRCKDDSCTDDKGYITAVWMPKEENKGSAKPPVRVEKKGMDCKAMIMAYAKDLVVANIQNTVDPCAETILVFRKLWEEYNK